MQIKQSKLFFKMRRGNFNYHQLVLGVIYTFFTLSLNLFVTLLIMLGTRDLVCQILFVDGRKYPILEWSFGFFLFLGLNYCLYLLHKITREYVSNYPFYIIIIIINISIVIVLIFISIDVLSATEVQLFFQFFRFY